VLSQEVAKFLASQPAEAGIKVSPTRQAHQLEAVGQPIGFFLEEVFFRYVSKPHGKV
jgi:hypothetical protein